MKDDIETMRIEARILAQDDLDRHRHYGHDLNIFSTEGMRDLWQHGWNGDPFPEWRGVEGSLNWRAWERGRQARLLKEEGK